MSIVIPKGQTLLADDFMASLADFEIYNKEQFLEMISKPRPFYGT